MKGLAWLAMVCGIVASAMRPAAWEQARPQQPTFRASADIVLIDVHVVARDGLPIVGVTPDQFEVFIDGRRRDVVSAQFVRSTTASHEVGTPHGDPAGVAPPAGGRVIVLAIDEASFPITAQASAREAAIRVVDRASSEDYLGLVTFPGQVEVEPTRDHARVREAISRIVGARVDVPSTSRFNLSASEAAAVRSRAPVQTSEIIDRACGREWPPNPSCPQEVANEANAIAITLEQQGMSTIAGLHRTLDILAPLSGRKTLAVISAGLPMSRQRGARPDFEGETARIASRVAAANVNLYVLYLNVHFLQFFSPAYGRANNSIYADIGMFGYGLEKIADGAGGAFFQVEVDSDPFVDRLLRETTAAYVLAVRAEQSDRDGREHFIRVAVKERNATVRYRRVVTIPRPGPRGSP